ncbi:hypothetical protein BKI52_27980 [marine bacterium AO1-C]|nr:hypothetical protein BKI52_27980 [marine bacterium AO1-C]
MAVFYDAGFSCPTQEDAQTIVQFFQDKTCTLTNQYPLTFNSSVNFYKNEWFASVHPVGVAWGSPETNVKLLKEGTLNEIGQLMYDIFQQQHQWQYYYGVFHAEAHERMMENELLVEILEDYEKEYVTGEDAAGSFKRYYTGLVLDTSLAKALSVQQVFDFFNSNYYWIPYDEF